MQRLLLVFALCFSLSGQTDALGLFTGSADIGAPAKPGSATFANGEYHVTGSGENIWGKRDQFHFVWREMSGNFTAEATVRFLGKGAEHRKAGIMVRQSLDVDAAYADTVIHGNGMPGLQWRSKKSEETNTFDLPFDGPDTFRIRFVRNGVKMYLYLARDNGEPKEIMHTEVSLTNPVLVGLFVCSHQAEAQDTVVFSNVTIEPQNAPATPSK